MSTVHKATLNTNPASRFKRMKRDIRSNVAVSMAALDGPLGPMGIPDPEALADTARALRRASDHLRSFLQSMEGSDG